MARKYELTWDKSKKRWKKFYKGRQYYFPFGDNKSDPEGYQLALDAWRKKKTEIDTDRQRNKPRRKEYEAAIKGRQDLAIWCRQNGDFEQGQILQAEADHLLDRFNKLDEPPALAGEEADPLTPIIREYNRKKHEEDPDAWKIPSYGSTEYAELRAVWNDRLKQLQQVATEKTVGAAIKSFMDRKEAKAKAGEMTAGYCAGLHAHLGRFQGWIGKNHPIESLGSKTLLDFHTLLLRLIDGKEIARSYAHDNMVTVRSFLRWCWDLDLCELPRNIDSKDLSFNVTPPKIRVLTKQEMTSLFTKAADRTRLYLLLALNAGMTQKDIADLKHEEVDWKQGRIVRKRSKTGDFDSVPTVSYQLWPETLALLKKHQSDHPELVLVNEKGQPLRQEAYGDGKYKRTDNVNSAYRRLAKKVKFWKPFKLIRKTGASKLEEHEIYRGFVQLYLGHSPRSIADRHYALPASDLFDRAICWLREQFGVIQPASSAKEEEEQAAV